MLTSSPEKDSLVRVESYLAQVRRDLRLPGLSIALVHEGQVIYSAGFGSAGAGQAVTSQTPFILGSLSKSFTAFAIMQLVDCGKLGLDDPVQTYILWFHVADPVASARVTIRHLLTHTSGLSRYVGRELLAGRGEKTPEQSVQELSDVKLVHAPGSQFEYSNSNYMILALLIEIISGESYPRYIERQVFQPLAMQQSYASEKDTETQLAQGYRWWFGFPFPFDAPSLYDAQGAAFLISSADDLARWLLLHLGHGSLEGIRFLSPAGMEQLHHPQINTRKEGSQAAMGWRVEKLAGESILRHGGEVSNFRADMILVPGRDLGVVTLQNGNNGLVAGLSLDQIAASVVRLLLGLPLPEKKLTFSRFYLGVDLAVIVLTILQVCVWPFLALSGGPTPLSVAFLVGDVLWPLWAIFWLPRVVDMPWRGLRLYVPDLYSWLIGLMGVSLVLNVVIISKWVF